MNILLWIFSMICVIYLLAFDFPDKYIISFCMLTSAYMISEQLKNISNKINKKE